MDNSFTGNEQYPMAIGFESVGDLSTDNTFTGNGKNQVYVESGNYNVDDATFRNIGIPYYWIYTGGSPLIRVDGDWVIEPGVTIKIGPNMMIEVEETGSFKCEGTASSRITIEGGENTRGYWDKIRFNGSQSNNNKITYTDVKDGGSFYDNIWYDKGMVTIKDIYDADSKITIQNSSFSNSLHYGIDLFECSSSGATVVNGETGAVDIEAALLSANTFSNNTEGDVRCTD